MGRFVRNIRITETFDGDTWTFELKPMTQAQAVELLTLTQRDPAPSEAEVSLAIVRMLPDSVLSVSGGTDAAGAPLTAEDVFGSAYFAALLGVVGSKWLAQSMPGN